MPERGLPENTCDKRILKRRRIEKPLSAEAKKLKERLATVQDQIKSIKSFDAQDHINVYCGQNSMISNRTY